MQKTLQDSDSETIEGSDRISILESQLCFALYSVSRQMTNAYRPLLAKLGLTYPQYLVLLVLSEEDDITIGELGSRLYLDFGTLTPLLKRLEDRKLVSRRRDPEDERHVRIRLTAQGHAIMDDVLAVRALLGGRLQLSSRHTARFRRELRQLMRLLLDANSTG